MSRWMSTIRAKVSLATGHVRFPAKDVEITSVWSVLTILFAAPQAEKEMVSHTALVDIEMRKRVSHQERVELLTLEMERT